MLFNSLTFLCLFAPVFYGLLLLARRVGNRTATLLTGIASLAFYGWTDWHSMPLLLISIAGNYFIGTAIVRARLAGGAAVERTDASKADRKAASKAASKAEPKANSKDIGSATPAAKRLMILGLVFNLGLLTWFKYSGLLARSVEALAGTKLGFIAPALPIGISFFTFTQIAFLVDAYYGKVQDKDPARYLLFVSYFPHLIAGPILHHAKMMPQFSRSTFGRITRETLIAGGTIFLIGLVKKVILADSAAQFVAPVFDATLQGGPQVSTMDAWIGALAYTCQLYFDFSGYTDMAIGLSRIMGVELPENFNSPYKARSIVDFWRRWHISLSNFLRDYLYIPLGGNRHGTMRRHLNLMITMLLGGLWHGASWTFLVWGGLHGTYLVINHAWGTATKPLGGRVHRLLAPLYWVLTLLAVIVAWVFFRADSFDSAFRMLAAMFLLAPGGDAIFAFDRATAWAWIVLCAAIALFLPNTRELIGRATQRLGKLPAGTQWNFGWVGCGCIAASIAVLTLIAESAAGRSPFIYFAF